jgi:hypothetical protein
MRSMVAPLSQSRESGEESPHSKGTLAASTLPAPFGGAASETPCGGTAEAHAPRKTNPECKIGRRF